MLQASVADKKLKAAAANFAPSDRNGRDDQTLASHSSISTGKSFSEKPSRQEPSSGSLWLIFGVSLHTINLEKALMLLAVSIHCGSQALYKMSIVKVSVYITYRVSREERSKIGRSFEEEFRKAWR